MAIQGIFNSDSGSQGARPDSFAATIFRLMPTGEAPMFALTSGMKTQNESNVIIMWYEEEFLTGRTTVPTEEPATETSVVVADGSYYLANDILLVEETGEYLFVTAVSGNTLTVMRGFAETTAEIIEADFHVQKIGNGFQEYSAQPGIKHQNPTYETNLMQIFRNTWGVSNTAAAVNFRTGNQPARSKMQCAQFHSVDIERALLWGRRGIGVDSNGNPIRFMNGVIPQIKTNVEVASSTTNYSALLAFVQDIFSWNIQGQPNERIAYCGNEVVKVLNQIARANSDLTINVGETSFGLQVMTFISPFGNIKLMTHPLFNANPVWSKTLLVMHPAAVTTHYLRPTDIMENTQNPGDDGTMGNYTTEMTISYHNERTAGLFTNLTKGIADT